MERRLGGGNSNVTELVPHEGGRVVLRRPPDAAISASAANGVRREYRMLRALAGKARVPAPLGFCDDAAIIGQPFIVVENVDGVAISTELPAGYPNDAATLNLIGAELVDAIGTVHALDWRELGLEAGTSEESYVSRQVKRWMSAREADAVRELPLIARIGRWLLAIAPPPHPSPSCTAISTWTTRCFATTLPCWPRSSTGNWQRSVIRSRTSGSPCVLGRPSRRVDRLSVCPAGQSRPAGARNARGSCGTLVEADRHPGR